MLASAILGSGIGIACAAVLIYLFERRQARIEREDRDLPLHKRRRW